MIPKQKKVLFYINWRTKKKMLRIPLAKLPNQRFSLSIDNMLFDIALKFCVNVMAADISINKTRALSGVRVEPNIPVIPYSYLQQGNFIFLCLNDEYPNYNNFGVSQLLFYLTQQEINALNNG